MEYIRIPCELLESDLWIDKLKPSTQHIFLQLLVRASHKKCTVKFMNRLFDLPKGACVITLRTFAKELSITDSKLRRALDKLEAYGLISTEATQSRRSEPTQNYKENRTIVTISNPEYYTGRREQPIDPYRRTSISESDALIGNNNEQEEVIKKRKSSLKVKPPQALVQLDPAAPNFRSELLDGPWIDHLAERLNQEPCKIEHEVLRFAHCRFLEGNLTLPLPLFRYRCGHALQQFFKPKNKTNHVNSNNTPQSSTPVLTAYNHPDVDPTRVPGYRASPAGSDDDAA